MRWSVVLARVIHRVLERALAVAPSVVAQGAADLSVRRSAHLAGGEVLAVLRRAVDRTADTGPERDRGVDLRDLGRHLSAASLQGPLLVGEQPQVHLVMGQLELAIGGGHPVELGRELLAL